MSKPKIDKISPENPDPDAIQNAAKIIREGGVVVFPTRCLYGLGADAFNARAVGRIFDIKQRPAAKPILILIDTPDRLEGLVSRISESAGALMTHFWPGRVTLVFEAGDKIPAYLTAGSGKIGIRLAGHPVAAALARAVQGPITGTSANLSGHPGCYRVEDLPPAITDKLDLVLDAGPLSGGSGSTVVDVTGDVPLVLREGVVARNEIMAAVSRSSCLET